MLNGKDVSKYDNGTSAESTIFRAVMIHTQSDENMRRVRAELEQFFASCVNQKKSFDIIITRLTRAPYGMRLGVLPFYILDSLLRLENMPIIYLNKKEVVLDLETVNNIVKHPKDYSLYVELETVQKAEYVHALETLFSDYSEYCREVDKKNRLAKISCMMQSWYRSLPQTSKTFEDPDRDDQDIKSIIAFRKLFTDNYMHQRAKCYIKSSYYETDTNGKLDYLDKAYRDANVALQVFTQRYDECGNEKLVISMDHIVYTQALILCHKCFINDYSDISANTFAIHTLHTALNSPYNTYSFAKTDSFNYQSVVEKIVYATIANKGLVHPEAYGWLQDLFRLISETE